MTAAWQALGSADDAFPLLKVRDDPLVMATVPSKTTLPLKTRLVPEPTDSVLQSTQLLPVTVTVPVGTLQFLVAVHRANEELTGWPLVPTAAVSWSTYGGDVTSGGQSPSVIP